MYEGAITRGRSNQEYTEDFAGRVTVHQGSEFSFYIFEIMVSETSSVVRHNTSGNMFADGGVVCSVKRVVSLLTQD